MKKCAATIRFSSFLFGGLALLAACAAVEPLPGYPPPPPPAPYPPPPGVPLSFAPAVVDFGEIPAGTAVQAAVSIRNEGRFPVRLQEAVVEGGAFRLQSDRCSGRRLDPGESCSVAVGFVPGGEGEYGGRLRVFLPESAGGEARVALAGAVRRPRGPEISAKPERLDFGGVAPGGSRTLPLEIRNEGRAPLQIQRVEVNGRGFSKSADSCSGWRLPPGSACSVSVQFAPELEGAFEGVVRVASNDRDESHLLIPLGGRARAKGIADVKVSPEAVDFGRTPVGSAKQAEVAVRNGGGAGLKILEVAARGPGFGVRTDGCSGRVLAPGTTCSVGVVFAPQAPGDQRGSLSIGSTDPDEPRVLVPLAGRATPSGPPACVARKVERLGERGRPDEAALSGSLEERGCLAVAVPIESDGALTVCATGGYELEGSGFEWVRGEGCRIKGQEGRLLRFRKREVHGGTEERMVFRRKDEAPASYQLLFRFRPGHGRDDED